MTAKTKTCCCPLDDAYDCFSVRYGTPRLYDLDGSGFEYLSDELEACECVCHDEEDEEDEDVLI